MYEAPKTPVLLIEHWTSGDLLRLQLTPVWLDGRESRTFGAYDEMKHFLPDLTIFAYCWPESVSYGACYDAAYSVDLVKAKRMLETLSHIDKSLKTVEKRDGWCQSVGVYVLRVARALGITQIAERDGDALDGWRIDANGRIADRVDFLYRDWKWQREHARTEATVDA